LARRSTSRTVAPRELLLLAALSTFGPISTDIYLPGLPSVAQDLAAPPWAAQATVTACFLGLGIGQLLVGSLSDAHGRRRPLLVVLGAYAVLSALCALAPNVWLLLAFRVAQGLAGGGSIAIASAIVRDRTDGAVAARTYATLMVVSGMAPIIGPVIGGQLLRVGDWRVSFAVLAAVGVVLLIAALAVVPETLAVALRRRGGFRTTRSDFGALLRDRGYVRFVAIGCFSFAATMAFITGSPFVFENVHGLSAQQFSLVFSLSAVAMVLGRQVARAVVGRTGALALVRAGTVVLALACSGALVATLADAGTVILVVTLLMAMGSIGVIGPNALALAMETHPERAGAASGVFGFVQFAFGSAVGPVVGVAGSNADVPMPLIMVCMSAGAVAMCAPLLWARMRRPSSVVR
jgi:DHA1 family bicyclomycin/chloramphenicol resistance-like MFS transporter